MKTVKEIVNIQLFILPENEYEDSDVAACSVCGIEKLHDAIADCIRTNREVIYLLINEPIAQVAIDNLLFETIHILKNDNLIFDANFEQLTMPENGGRFYTIYTKNNLIKQTRYLISLLKKY